MTDTASLIEEIEALGKVFKSDNAVNDAYQAALIDAISIIRSHCPTQPEPAADVVEAVARAICLNHGGEAVSIPRTSPDEEIYHSDKESHYHWEDFVPEAKAAIAALPQAQAAGDIDEYGLLIIIRNILKNHNEQKAGNSDKGYAILAALRPWLRTAQGKHRYQKQRTPEEQEPFNGTDGDVDRFLACACTHGNACEEIAQNHFMMIEHTSDTPEYCHTYKQSIEPKPKINRTAEHPASPSKAIEGQKL